MSDTEHLQLRDSVLTLKGCAIPTAANGAYHFTVCSEGIWSFEQTKVNKPNEPRPAAHKYLIQCHTKHMSRVWTLNRVYLLSRRPNEVVCFHIGSVFDLFPKLAAKWNVWAKCHENIGLPKLNITCKQV